MSINNVLLVGRLTRTPETVWTNKGVCVLEFSLAVNTPRKEADGTITDDVSFFECVMYGKRAEKLSEIIHKGMKITVSGKLQQQRWTNKDGQNRSKVRILASQIELPPKPTALADFPSGEHPLSADFGGNVINYAIGEQF